MINFRKEAEKIVVKREPWPVTECVDAIVSLCHRIRQEDREKAEKLIQALKKIEKRMEPIEAGIAKKALSAHESTGEGK